jgi:hypothetical protein
VIDFPGTFKPSRLGDSAPAGDVPAPDLCRF